MTNTNSVSTPSPYLAVFDLDETLIAADSASLWIAYLVEQGFAQETLLLEEKNIMLTYQKGRMDMHAYMATTLAPLIGMDMDEVNHIVADFIEKRIKPAIYADALARIQWHKQRGDTVLVISATGEHLVTPIAHLLGADDAIATNLQRDNGKITGNTINTLSYQQGKVIRMKAWLKEHNGHFQGSYGYSDSINDLPLLEAVDRPFAVNPDPTLALHAQLNDWTIMDWRHDNNILR